MPQDPAELMPLVYDELRRIAANYVRGERPGQTLQATALVNEAFVRMAAERTRHFNGRTHFLAIAALSMRQILIQRARARRALKRGGAPARVTLDDARVAPDRIQPGFAPPDQNRQNDIDVLALDEALRKLAELDDALARIVELRYFGALIPRFVRIRLMPETDGDPVSAYRARPGVSPSTPSTANDEKSLAGKTVLTLSTVEHWLGTPVFDGVLAAFARASHTQPPTLESFAGVASASSGQDLSWLLHQAFGGAATFDYAVTDFSSVSNSEGRFATRVVVSRLGDGVFSGASAPRVGPYESGRGITMAVVFADGERAIDTWDGRDERRVFEYRSASRAQSATVDPDRKLLLDINQTNNSLTTTNWTAYGGTISSSGGTNSVSVTPAVGNLFFRLR